MKKKFILLAALAAASLNAQVKSMLSPVGPWALCPAVQWACEIGASSQNNYMVLINDKDLASNTKFLIVTVAANLDDKVEPVALTFVVERSPNMYGYTQTVPFSLGGRIIASTVTVNEVPGQ